MGNLFLLVALLCIVKGISSAGSGRAFPIESENYIIQNFQRINGRLEWDPSNYLVDMSGLYANCRYIGTRDFVSVDFRTPTGDSVAAYVDYTDGRNADVNSVIEYIKKVVDRWMVDRNLHNQISSARRFGCSVRPGCSGEVSIGCLFSPAASGQPKPDPNIEPGTQKAVAFTPEQYKIAEDITDNRWDRSHFLENLSGYETDCAMIGNDEWPFAKSQTMASAFGVRLLGTYGYEPNYGSTPVALEKILKQLKKIKVANRVGCSLISDCILDEQMYVVVSCIYEER